MPDIRHSARSIFSFLERRETAAILRCDRSELRMRTVFLPERKVIYFINPKVGSSTIIRSLLAFDGPNRSDEDFYRKEMQRQISSERDPRLFLRMLRDQSCYRFTFVRHPVGRILSCYRDKIVRESNARFRTYLGLNPSGAVSLTSFLEAVAAQKPEAMNRHWRPQSLLIPASVPVTIKKFEAFEPHLAEVAEEASLEGFKLIDHSSHSTGKPDTDALDPTDLRLIQQIYADDFSRFGYA